MLSRAAYSSCWHPAQRLVVRRAPFSKPAVQRPFAALAKQIDLGWVPAENRDDVARIVEQAGIAARTWDILHTDFVTPPVAADAKKAVLAMGETAVVSWGGYPQAERCRLAVGREDVMAGLEDTPGGVSAIEIKGNFMFDPATHRDFLGAMLGAGVKREAVGDILVQGENGAQALIAEHLAEFFEQNLTKVRTVPVITTIIPLSQLRVKPPKVEDVKSIEASLRLDAVASAGFRVPRSKMMDLVKAGNVRVNWRAVTKPSVEVKAGDVLSCADKGRVEIKTVEMTKKDKYVVCMVRYV